MKNSTPKKWYYSKTVWFNVVLTLVDIIALASDLHIGGETAVLYLAFAQGIGNVILRVWFTEKPVTLK